MNSDNETLKTSSIDELKTEIEQEEIDLPPPPTEDNQARQLNVTNILIVIMIIIAIVIGLATIFSGKKQSKNQKLKQLDKSGSKMNVEFSVEKNPNQEKIVENQFHKAEETSAGKADKEESIEETLNSLPDNLQLPQQSTGTAPVVAAGQKYSSSRTERPDTRTSKSPRKGIDGIKGLSSSNNYFSDFVNQNIINSVLNNNSNYGMSEKSGVPFSRQEYIDEQINNISKIQSAMGKNNDISSIANNFFTENAGNTAGTFLSDYSLWDGTIISGALITGINTDNPGVVVARVTENVYSSYDHSYLLIPEGSLLYATYNSSVSYGQNRVQVAWNLLIRPDGYRMELGNMNGIDPQGYSGYKGFVNNHPFETLKALGLVAVFSIIQTEITNDLNSIKNEYLNNALTDVYSETSKINNKIINKALDIKPTITIRQGTEIKFITNVPLNIPPFEVNNANKKYIRR